MKRTMHFTWEGESLADFTRAPFFLPPFIRFVHRVLLLLKVYRSWKPLMEENLMENSSLYFPPAALIEKRQAGP